jgi:phage terminase Nu1 subunit (DNA packaging protein)
MSNPQPKSTLPETISLDELRVLLGGVTVSHVNGLQRQGILEKTERGTYTLKSVPAYIRWLRQVGAGPASWQEARTALTNERVALLRLERGEREGRLLDRDDVRSMNISIASTVKARMLSVGSRVAPSIIGLRSPAEAQAIVDEAVREGLAELARLGER